MQGLVKCEQPELQYHAKCCIFAPFAVLLESEPHLTATPCPRSEQMNASTDENPGKMFTAPQAEQRAVQMA